MSLSEVLSQHRVVVCVGSGGVGKTTTSAALALHAAMEGRRVLCLTIDPARRLANSLGLSEMQTSVQRVPKELFEEHGLTCRGELSAMMLDTKQTFDDLVRQHASSPEARDRILGNKIYQYMSTSLAGTQEYMAMEKLHAVRQDPQWDLIVLDTPPTANALDFLNAPERLVDALDSPTMRWFVTAFEGAGRLSLGLVGKGAAFLLRGLTKFTGAGFLEQVAEFVVDMNELFGGFKERATRVANALRSPEVAFVVVTDPRAMSVREAIYFADRLREANIPQGAFVVNGVHPVVAEPEVPTEVLEAQARQVLPASVDAERAVHRMRRAFDDEHLMATADHENIQRLEERADKAAVRVWVPAFDEDVHDVGALSQVARYLTGQRSIEDDWGSRGEVWRPKGEEA